jgi:glycosyltransferase involved in cell wall biosynthesis
MNKVTILILSHNRSWSLQQCVGSIREWTRWPYHIVIQDHASDPEHWEAIRQLEGTDCTVLRANSFLSCNEGRRVGLDHVQGEHVVFLDDDIKVERLWLSRMMKEMARPGVGVVCGQLLQNFGKYKMSWARMLVNGTAQRMEYGFTGLCDFCGGGATLYEVAALRGSEFRKEFNGTGEDWDQILQIAGAGYKIWSTDVHFFHFHQGDYDEYGTKRWRYTEIMDSALALYTRWGIRNVAIEVLADMVSRGLPLQAEQRKVMDKVMEV